MVKAGCPWRMLPGDFPPWQAVEQQAKRWMEAGCFASLTHDLRELLRLLQERNPRPTAVILDGRTMQSSPESGGRAGYDGYKRKKGSKVHLAVDTLGNLLALLVTPANAQERAQVGELAKQVQEATQRSVKLAYVDQGYTGEKPAAEAAAHGIELEVVKLAEAKRGFVLLPRRWVIERSLCLAGSLPTLVAGLRTASYHPRRTALAGFFVPVAQQLVQNANFKFMTGSSDRSAKRRKTMVRYLVRYFMAGTASRLTPPSSATGRAKTSAEYGKDQSALPVRWSAWLGDTVTAKDSAGAKCW